MSSKGRGLWARLRAAWRNITLADFQQLNLLEPVNVSGIAVTPASAMNYSAVWNAVNVISSQVATLPRVLYRRLEDDSRERATSHPAYRVINGEPNPTSTNYVFWQTVVAHALTWGNGYAEIEFDRALRPIALWPITPDLIEPMADREVFADGRVTFRVWYRYKGSRRLEAEDVLHIPGLAFDGIRGYAPVTLARQSIGLGMAAEQFGAAFFGNGAYPGVVLEHPGKLSPDAQTRLKTSWRRDSNGPNALGVQVAEEGMKVQKVGIPPDDAQFLETREFQVVEIARWFNIPPHKLKHKIGERPGGNIEASQTEFLTDTLLPWLTTIEQECNRKLISKTQQGTYYVEHLTNALLRPDAKTRSEIQKAYYDMGVLSADAIAKQENLPDPEPVKPSSLSERIEQAGQLIRAGFDPGESLAALGLPSIKHLGLPPVTVQTPEVVEPEPPPPPPPGDEPDDDEEPDDEEPTNGEAGERMARAQRALLLDVSARFVRREAFHIRRAAKMGAQQFGAWLGPFYEREEELLRSILEPAVGFVLAVQGSSADGSKVAAGIAATYVNQSREALGALPHRNLEDAAGRLVERWETTRPVELAERLAAASAAPVQRVA